MAARADLQLRSMLLPLGHCVRQRQYQLVAEAYGCALGSMAGFTQRVEAVLATVRFLGIRLVYGRGRDEVNATWAIARDDFVAGFQRDEAVMAKAQGV